VFEHDAVVDRELVLRKSLKRLSAIAHNLAAALTIPSSSETAVLRFFAMDSS